jgi:DNA mismatch endonuclease (patch repair protein)
MDNLRPTVKQRGQSCTERSRKLPSLPKPPSAEVRRRMQNTRQKHTGIELNLRAILHSLGLRFRLHCRVIPGSTRSADIVFPSAKVVVFVDSCFWHCCPTHRTFPKANNAWWRAKLAQNRKRDRDTNAILARLGWRVLRVWQHDHFALMANRIERIVRERLRTDRAARVRR